jgi:hypothetical protein
MAKVKVKVPVASVKYEVTLSQKELDVIVGLLGTLTGGGEVRKVSAGIWEKIEGYSSGYSGRSMLSVAPDTNETFEFKRDNK